MGVAGGPGTKRWKSLCGAKTKGVIFNMAAATKEPKKVKKGFKMPHLFWIMIGLLFLSSLLTYLIPAGQFMTDPATGKILGDQFVYLDAQTPVSPLKVMLLLIDGMVNSSLVIMR